jgi:hypothetical protein
MLDLPIARPTIPFRMSGPLPSVGAAAGLTALADWLLFRHTPGISVAIFVAALCAAVLMTNKVTVSRTGLAAGVAVLAAALLPAIEDFGILSVAVAIAGASAFTLLATGWPARPALQRLGDLCWMVVCGPFRLASDLRTALRLARQHDNARHGANWLKAWIVPLGLGSVFLVLFSQANPLIETWLTGVDASRWRDLDPLRPLFWLVAIALTWPFLRVRPGGRPTLQGLRSALGIAPATPSRPPAPDGVTRADASGPLFGATAILRSLVLFNALFAVQSVMDITYLWGGVALPAGMSYADYAHRGAYPLIATALLAGAFVLAAMQPGTTTERSRLIRALVFVWIGQNVLLVLSSMLRLDLYVGVYSLTRWRCAAFIWMLLVAVGLTLIVARIALGRPNRWLIWSNAAVLALTLYVCSLVDFSRLIADFNVEHSVEMTGAGVQVDVDYLCGLGPAALPAIDRLTARLNADGRLVTRDLARCRRWLAMLHETRMDDWRAWTFRGHRLMRSLEPTADAVPPAG